MPSSGVYQPGEDPFQEQLLQFTSLLKLANLSQRYKQGKKKFPQEMKGEVVVSITYYNLTMVSFQKTFFPVYNYFTLTALKM